MHHLDFDLKPNISKCNTKHLTILYFFIESERYFATTLNNDSSTNSNIESTTTNLKEAKPHLKVATTRPGTSVFIIALSNLMRQYISFYIQSYLINGAHLVFLCYLLVARSLGEEQRDGWFSRDSHRVNHCYAILLLEAGKDWQCTNTCWYLYYNWPLKMLSDLNYSFFCYLELNSLESVYEIYYTHIQADLFCPGTLYSLYPIAELSRKW